MFPERINQAVSDRSYNNWVLDSKLLKKMSLLSVASFGCFGVQLNWRVDKVVLITAAILSATYVGENLNKNSKNRNIDWLKPKISKCQGKVKMSSPPAKLKCPL